MDERTLIGLPRGGVHDDVEKEVDRSFGVVLGWPVPARRRKTKERKARREGGNKGISSVVLSLIGFELLLISKDETATSLPT